MKDEELIKDLEMLAKQVHEIAKKHGNIYIATNHCHEFKNRSSATAQRQGETRFIHGEYNEEV